MLLLCVMRQLKSSYLQIKKRGKFIFDAAVIALCAAYVSEDGVKTAKKGTVLFFSYFLFRVNCRSIVQTAQSNVLLLLLSS